MVITALLANRYLLKDSHLVTRQLGAKIREDLAKYIQKMEETVLLLNFNKVQLIDFSCADEVIVRLLARVNGGEFGNKYVVLTNLRDGPMENIHAALKMSGKAILSKDQRGGWALLGVKKVFAKKSLAVVMKHKEITTRQMMDILRIGKPNVVSNWLGTLCDDGLLHREKKTVSERGAGKQFIYRALF